MTFSLKQKLRVEFHLNGIKQIYVRVQAHVCVAE